MTKAQQQAKYKKSKKGKEAQSRWYKSATKKKWDKEWRKNNKEKTRAHSKVEVALNNGILKKQPCIVCSKKKAQAHHPDYSKPLKVVWLCALHHAREHIRLKRKKGKNYGNK